MEKQLWRPPRGAGVEVEVAASAQLSTRGEKMRGAGRGEGRLRAAAEHRARTLFRLRRSASAPGFSGSRSARPGSVCFGRLREGKQGKPGDRDAPGDPVESCAQLGAKSFWERRLWCRPRRRLAARVSFPFPRSGPGTAAGGGEEGYCHPSGNPQQTPVTRVG